MVGLLSTWIMEVCYILAAGILAHNFDNNLLREVFSLAKMFEFCLVPIAEIASTPSLRSFAYRKLFTR
jgi:hypothetical protein